MELNFQKILWIIAGAEPSILEKCRTDYKKFSSIGATILMTSFIAFCAGTCAAWYFTQDGESMKGALGWSILFGVIWACLIFCIDRSLVITLKKDPNRKHQNFWIPLLSRAVLAAVIAFMVSIPLELFIFRDYINENIENFKESKAGQLGDMFRVNSGEDVLNTRINSADKTLNKLNQTSQKLSKEIISLEKQINKLEAEKNYPNSTAYNSAKNRYNNAQQSYNKAQIRLNEERNKQNPSQAIVDNQRSLMTKYSNERNTAKGDMNVAATEWKKSTQRQIDELVKEKDKKSTEKKRIDDNYDATLQNKNMDMQSVQKAEETRRESEQIKKTQMERGNKFLLNFQILEFAVWQRDKNGNLTEKTQLWFLWLIRLLFFIIEILPTVVKIVTPVGSYDRVVYAQEKSMEEYLNSPQFIDSMREIHKSEIETQLDEAKLHQEAELRMKKDILEKMTAAQIDIANLAIEKWEETERLKYTGHGAGNDSVKLLSEERKAEDEVVIPSVSDSTIS